MNHLFKTLICCCLFLPFAVTAQSNLVPFGTSWDYYDAGNEPADNGGNDWNDLNYSHSWQSGNAELGYGDNDETTTINASTLTGYFRKKF